MPTVYFLDGLGSNEYYALPLNRALAEQGIDLVYLSLPEEEVDSLDDFVVWFDKSVADEAITLMGFSLGADLGAYLAYASQKVARLILLDGGLLDVSKTMPLEKELAEAAAYLDQVVIEDLEAYIAEQASQTADWTDELEQAERHSFYEKDGRYYLKLTKKEVCGLLTLRYKAGLPILKSDYQTPTLAIVAQEPKSLLAEKKATLEQASKDYVSSLILPDTSHNLYREAPDKIALATRFFLDAF